MSRPKVETVRRAILETPLEVKRTVWRDVQIKKKGRRVSIRQHYFGYWDEIEGKIVLGRYMNRLKGMTEELVDTHIHEALHKVRPDWDEERVQMEEGRYARSRVLREASLVKLVNVALFGRDLDAVRERKTKAVHVGEAPVDSTPVGPQVREQATQ